MSDTKEFAEIMQKITSGLTGDPQKDMKYLDEKSKEYKYNSDPNNMVSMLGEYGEMMQKYADFAEKIDKYDSSSMSTGDSKYYIEVTTRCAQKMLEAY